MRALILVDLQYDFMPGGALAVPDGDAVVAVANRLMPHFDLVVGTQDWHPPNHGSFASQHKGHKPGDVIELNGLRQILWPDHCVQHSEGARLHHALHAGAIGKVIQKGTDPGIDSYSTFFDNAHRKDTGLADYLRDKGASEIFLMGLATDYCVKFSALDARKLSFDTRVIEDGCRGIDMNPGDIARTFGEMREAGAVIVRSSDLAAATTFKGVHTTQGAQ
jgi:nicotinamidase/pyrazinamidase